MSRMVWMAVGAACVPLARLVTSAGVALPMVSATNSAGENTPRAYTSPVPTHSLFMQL